MTSTRAGSRRAGRLALLLLAGASLSGCSLLGDRAEREAVPDPELIARNLVHTLAQLPELDPRRTTVQVSSPTTAFGHRVLARLDEAGYGIQEVAADQGAHYVRYRAEHAQTETGERTRYRVAIGGVSVERDYRIVGGKTYPGSAQSVEGAEAREVTLNDELFVEVPAASFTETRFAPRTMAAVVPDAVDEPELSAASVAAAMTSAAGSPGIDGIVRQNMFETRRSNYAPLFTGYEDVREDTLIFANDSLVLGEANKVLIADYARELDPETDVVSVIGCSHGRSAIDNGNELLAIGRANRVKEAFLFAGVAHDRVLEESCWAGSYHTVFPRRGVVLTLKRRLEPA